MVEGLRVDPSSAPTPAASPTPPRPTSQNTVELRGVTHRFGENLALNDLSFVVPDQQITVLLGPNGAGKTTAIRAITGALAPHEGTVRTFGCDPSEEGDLVRPRCGVVSAKPALYDRLSGYDNLLYSAQLYDVPKARIAERIDAVATRFGIGAALSAQVGGFSTGMKTRLALARSVLHEPDLLLFDEPTSGLDPESSLAVLDLIREMTSEGCTVVMCTHLLAEAEGLADHIVIMEAGTDLTAGSADTLTAEYWPGNLLVLDAETPDQLDRVANWQGVVAYDRVDVANVYLDGFGRVPEIVASLAADGVRLTRVEPRQPTLEDLYFTIRRQSKGAGLSPVSATGQMLGSLAGAERSATQPRPANQRAEVTTR